MTLAMNDAALADRGATAVHEAATCAARAVAAQILGDVPEARKQLEDARALVQAARECAGIIGDQGVLDACDRARLVLLALAGLVTSGGC